MDVVPPGASAPIGTITFAGPGHQKSIVQSEAATKKRLFEERQRQTNNRWKPAERTPEQLREENARFVVDRMLSWDGAFMRRDESGNIVPIQFSEEAAVTLLLDPRKGWLFSQCLEFLGANRKFYARLRREYSRCCGARIPPRGP
jgi:hypothetical protein